MEWGEDQGPAGRSWRSGPEGDGGGQPVTAGLRQGEGHVGGLEAGAQALLNGTSSIYVSRDDDAEDAEN